MGSLDLAPIMRSFWRSFLAIVVLVLVHARGSSAGIGTRCGSSCGNCSKADLNDFVRADPAIFCCKTCIDYVDSSNLSLVASNNCKCTNPCLVVGSSDWQGFCKGTKNMTDLAKINAYNENDAKNKQNTTACPAPMKMCRCKRLENRITYNQNGVDFAFGTTSVACSSQPRPNLNPNPPTPTPTPTRLPTNNSSGIPVCMGKTSMDLNIQLAEGSNCAGCLYYAWTFSCGRAGTPAAGCKNKGIASERPRKELREIPKSRTCKYDKKKHGGHCVYDSIHPCYGQSTNWRPASGARALGAPSASVIIVAAAAAALLL